MDDTGTPFTSMIAVRHTPDVIKTVRDTAHAEGITVSSWIRRAISRALEPAEPETVEVTAEGLAEPLKVPAAALREVVAALLPALVQHGSVALQLGTPRPEGLIPGSGRRGDLKALPSSRSLGAAHTFACPHMSIGGVVSASCGTCGPMYQAA